MTRVSLADVRAGADRGLFVRAQLVGWPVFGVVYFLAVLPTSDVPPGLLLGFKVIWSLTGLAVSSLLALVYRRLRLAGRRPSAALGLAAVVGTFAGGAWVVSLGAVASVMGRGGLIYTAASFPFVAVNHAFILLAWSGAYLTLSYWRRSETEQRKSLAAMGLAREAQLEMLRYQLNPHFLYNAMASARALITEHPDRARETITRLSDFLRYTLSRRNGTLVTVAEEVQIVRDYLAIEMVRFEERLEAAVDLDPSIADERIPSFLLHSLVENAVKHGGTHAGTLVIRVRAGRHGSRLELAVSNTGRFTPPGDEGLHVGLTNVRQRLAASYPGHHGFTIEQRGDLVHALVAIDLDAGKGRRA